MSLLKILFLLRSLPISELLRFPEDIKDVDEVGDYLAYALAALGILSEETSTEIDDKVVSAIGAVLSDQEAWRAIHGVFVVLFLAKEDDYVDVVCPPSVKRVADAAGFNPLLIISIVQAVIAFFRIFNKKKDE